MNNNATKQISLSFCSMGFTTFIVFLILKLTHTIDWNWFWIWFPLWIPIASSLLIALIIIAISLIIAAKS